MKRKITHMRRVAAMAVGLFAMAVGVHATVFEPGQQVTEFVVNEDYGIVTAPTLSTDDMLDNWAYGSYNDGNVIAYTDQRGWRAVFELNAPADGKYGVEVKLRTTTTNWMVAFNSSQGLDVSERASIEVAPEWTNMARPTKISTVTSETIEIQPAQGNPEDEDYVPAITETVNTFSSGEWETVYVPVDLKQGHNYVTFWLCRTYQGIDNLKGPEGSINGFYVQSIKVLPQGSGDVAAILQRATLKLWEQRMYPTMITEGSANLLTDYTTLLNAYSTASDYNALSTTNVENGIDAVTVREEDLRHGKGVILNSDSVAFALPYYHELQGGSISENERGEYSDAPMVFEYTNGKTLIYKFTTTEAGIFYPMLYAGTQLSTNFHLNIYTEDGTKLVDDWTMTPNTGAWQVYQMWSQPAVSSFEAEAGQTYYLSLYFENYVNVRGLYLLQVLQKPKTYEELEALRAHAEDVYAQYQPGSDGYYAIGANDALVGALEEAIAMASDLDENSSAQEITDAYYAMEDAIAKIEAAPKINVIPTTETSPFVLSNGTLSSWRIEGAGNIGYGYANGYAKYTIYNKEDAKYDINLTVSNGASDISVYSVFVDVDIDEENTVRVASVDMDFEGTGEWGNQTNLTIPGVAIPAGKVNVTFFGTQAASNGYVGNIYEAFFNPVPGTEGQGAQALETATEAYYALYTVENLQALIQQAQEAILQYPYPTYDQTQVNKVLKAIEAATEALTSDKVGDRAKAYQNLEAAIANLVNSSLIKWIDIPTTEDNPFDLSAGTFTSWRLEGAGNIGYGYQGGSVLYYVNVTATDNYEMRVEMANPADGGQIRITATSDDDANEYYNQVIDVPNTGSWSDHQDVVANMNLPEGRIKLLLYGETAAGNWVGNIYKISIIKGNPEGISEIVAANHNMGVYNLQGQFVGNTTQKLPQGIYIVNGRKQVVK